MSAVEASRRARPLGGGRHEVPPRGELSCGRLAAALFWVAAAPAALAAHGDIAGFGDGVLHVLGGRVHWLAAVAAGVWAMAFAWRRGWVLPIAFAAAVAAGAGVGAAGGASSAVDMTAIASVIVLGALIATGRTYPRAAAIAIVAVFGLVHGYSEGALAGKTGSVTQYAIGVSVASLALGIAGAGVGLMLRLVSRYGLRVAGVAIAAAGVWSALGR